MSTRSGIKRGGIEKERSITFMDVHSGRVHVMTERKSLYQVLKTLNDVKGNY